MVTNGKTSLQETNSLFERARTIVVCWWALLSAGLSRRTSDDAKVERCLQLKKGTKFRLSGGEMHLVVEKDLRTKTRVSGL